VEARDIATAIARGRIGLGAAAIAAPGFVARAMFGSGGSRPGTRALARMLGGRDMALGLGVVIALDRGAPVRGWLEASALADGVDFLSCLVAKDDIPKAMLANLLVLTAGTVLTELWLSRELDPPPPASPGHPEAVATGHSPEGA
jgi:hypothetical protein